MSPNTMTDTRSKNTETPAPERNRLAAWFLTGSSEKLAAPETAPADRTPDSEWATEALFDYYNS